MSAGLSLWSASSAAWLASGSDLDGKTSGVGNTQPISLHLALCRADCDRAKQVPVDKSCIPPAFPRCIRPKSIAQLSAV